MPARVAVAVTGDWELRAMRVWRISERVTTARGLGAQAGDQVQSGDGVAACAALP
jgi:hypothetical protein